MDFSKSTRPSVLGIHSIPFNLVSTFNLSIHLHSDGYGAQISDLLLFLASAPSTTDVNLVISATGVFDARRAEAFQSAHCKYPSITSFRLALSSFLFGDYGVQFVATSMKAFCIPNIEQLSLSIRFYDKDLMDHGVDEKESTELLTGLSNTLLASNPTHHHLKSLSYELLCPCSPNYGTLHKLYREVNVFTRTFTIPLDRIPNVSSLTLTTFAQTFFTRGESSIAGRSNPCSLREVRFRDCARTDCRNILQGTIRSLNDVGAWDTLERFVVEDCNGLDYETALNAVGTEKLRFLISSSR